MGHKDDAPPKTSMEKMAAGYEAVALAEDDPDDTLTYTHTRRELALFALGISLVGSMFPEFADDAKVTALKMMEVSHHQGFLSFDRFMGSN